jgi:UDP-glucose 6-dehydrogenase
MAFAAYAGPQVKLLDTDADTIAIVNNGQMPFHEDDADELLPQLADQNWQLLLIHIAFS